MCYSYADRLNRNLNIATINLSRCEFNCFIKRTEPTCFRAKERVRVHGVIENQSSINHTKDLKFKSTSIKHVRVFRTSCFVLLFGDFMVQETRETRRCERLKSDDISPPFDICLTMLPIKIDVAYDKNICQLWQVIDVLLHQKNSQFLYKSRFLYIYRYMKTSSYIEKQNILSLSLKYKVFLIYQFLINIFKFI